MYFIPTKVSSFPLQVDFTFDKAVMSEILKESRDMLLKLVNTHLTPKSHGRINHVFNHYADPELLNQLYNPSGPLKPHLTKICNGLNKLLENGTLWGWRSTERHLQDWHGGQSVISNCIQCNQRGRKWLTESIALQFNLWNSVDGLLMKSNRWPDIVNTATVTAWASSDQI